MPYNMVIVSHNKKKQKKKRLTDRKSVGIKQQQKQTASQIIFLHWVKRINSKWGKLKNIHGVLNKKKKKNHHENNLACPHRRQNEVKWKNRFVYYCMKI